MQALLYVNYSKLDLLTYPAFPPPSYKFDILSHSMPLPFPFPSVIVEFLIDNDINPILMISQSFL